jgi:hypothetical protein
MASVTSNQNTSSSPNDPDAHPTVSSCLTTGFPLNREPLCATCQYHMLPTDATVTHSKCLKAFHAICFDDLVASSTDLINSRDPAPTKCPICRGEVKPWSILGCAPSPAVQSAEAEVRRPARSVPPRWERSQVWEAAEKARNAAAAQAAAQARRNAERQRERPAVQQQQRFPLINRIRSLIPANEILLSALMFRLITPSMHQSVRAALQRCVLTAGRLDNRIGVLMPY